MTVTKRRKTGTAKGSEASAPAFYLYGVSATAEGISSVQCPGVDGKFKVRAIAGNGLSCWISEVDREEFVVNFQSRIDDLEWLADAAVNHQKTVERLAGQTVLVPARFGAVYLSGDSVRKDVRARSKHLTQTLKRFENTEEWGVKILHAPQAAGPLPKRSSGRDYLRQKAGDLKKRLQPPPGEALQEFVNALQENSMAWAPGQAASRQNLVWQGSFLLKKGSHSAFDAILRDFAGRWQATHQIECTGPWPPYSFV